MMWFSHPAWGQNTALIDADQQLTYVQLEAAVEARSDWLLEQNVSRVALLMDNQIEWVLFDLACQQAGICCVPVPVFFSVQQTEYLLGASAIELLIVETERANAFAVTSFDTPFKKLKAQSFQPHEQPELPEGTHKITFTSGTTGAPKGVCLSTDSQLVVARSLVSALALQDVKHLSLLPLATLLENIAGIYAPLLVGGTVYLASQQQRGFEGSRMVQPKAMLALINQVQPTSLILVPELLWFMVQACHQGWQPPESLVFIAVGGGKVSAQMLITARQLGLPVYQGYGLSEFASVVALNTPNNDHLLSAGTLLEHSEANVIDGELTVRGNLFLGYMNHPESFYPTQFATGDLVDLKANVLTIQGRRKNIIINSFGRNFSPEWVESELLASQISRSVVVFGEARAYCGAILVLMSSEIPDDLVKTTIEQVNAGLPDYAQIKGWVLAMEPFEASEGLVTATGKPIRDAILDHYKDRINDLYQSNHHSDY